MGPKLLIGLGNPGISYAGTRHNIGFDFLDFLAINLSLNFKIRGLYEIATLDRDELSLALIKSKTFMNFSGEVVASLQSEYRFNSEEDLMVITDNVDLPVGRMRLKKGNTRSTHNGLRSINISLGFKSYTRLLIGVGSAPDQYNLSNWVLSVFGKEEKKEIGRIYRFLVQIFSQPFSSFEDLQPMINSFR